MIIGCMSVFNEARMIRTAIKSLSWVDRMIVVDGSYKGYPIQGNSTDRTVPIALALGAEVILAPPGLTQIAKRNRYLVGRPGDYYVVLDADEVWHGTPDQLTHRAYRVKHSGRHWIPPTVRVFKHGARYKGAHNRLYYGKKKIDETRCPMLDGVHIEHRKDLRSALRLKRDFKYFMWEINHGE